MLDLAKVVEFIECAMEQLSVHKQYVDPVACLNDLNGIVAIIVKSLVANNNAIFGVRPTGQSWYPVDQSSFEVENFA